MSASFVSEPFEYKVDAPAALDPGEVIDFLNGAGVYNGLVPAASGEKVTIRTKGTWNLTKAGATEFAAGDPVYYNTSTELAVTTPGANVILAGVCVVAAGDGPTVVLTALNEYFEPVST